MFSQDEQEKKFITLGPGLDFGVCNIAIKG